MASADGRAGRRLLQALAGACVAAMGLAACDDQIKYIPIFSTMSEQPSRETYEEPVPRQPVPGTMPIDGEIPYTLIEADTALTNPGGGDLERGAILYGQFCTVCHGPRGRGDGSVVGANRIPPLPLLDITSARTAGFSDGYIWGMITNGRGLMPSYRRIPADERWHLVDFVRDLQRRAGTMAAGDTGTPPGEAAGTPPGGGENP